MPPVLFCEVLFMSTIAAVATPDAVGGISVIRISGEKSLEIADKIFKNYAGKAPSQMDGYTLSLIHI